MLEITQLRREHVLRNAGKHVSQFAETARPSHQCAEDFDFPFADHGMNRALEFGDVHWVGSTSRRTLGSRFGLDRDFAVDELAVVYPILNAIFDPIPIVAEETDSFVRGRIG